jgi:tRNA/rRNA methyltransferase
MVITYEIFDAKHQGPTGTGRSLAEVGSLEQMFQQMEDTLLKTGFLDRENPQHIMRDLRRIFGRAALDEREVRILRGILRQTNWAVGRNLPNSSNREGEH